MSTFIPASLLSTPLTAASTLLSSAVSVDFPVSKWTRAGKTDAAAGAAASAAGAAAGAAGAGAAGAAAAAGALGAAGAAGAAGALAAGAAAATGGFGTSLPPISGTMSSATMLM